MYTYICTVLYPLIIVHYTTNLNFWFYNFCLSHFPAIDFTLTIKLQCLFTVHLRHFDVEAILTALTSRVTFNLTVQVVYIIWPMVWAVMKHKKNSTKFRTYKKLIVLLEYLYKAVQTTVPKRINKMKDFINFKASDFWNFIN